MAHTIDFFFDFTEEGSAELVCKELQADGFTPHLEGDEESGRFTYRAVKSMVPDLATMQALTKRFSALAAENAGVYDGWGCPIVK